MNSGYRLPTRFLTLFSDRTGSTFFVEALDFYPGAETRPLQASTLKPTSDRLRDAITKFDELRSRYIGPPYEQMSDKVVIRRGAS
jgi:hypothetical protein